MKSKHAPGTSRGQIGDAGGAQFLVEVDILLDGDFQGGGIEQNGDDGSDGGGGGESCSLRDGMGIEKVPRGRIPEGG